MKKQLEKIRDDLDKIDDEIMVLITKRLTLAKKIGKLKKAAGKNVFDPKRESLIIDRLHKNYGNKIKKEEIKLIYNSLYKISKKRQS
tara:strand:- start:311 stop:571 length:261 start_codon:yes stop_codon:yes gene_type:complete